MSQIKIWVLVSVASSLAGSLAFIIRVLTAEVIKRLDNIMSELKQVTKATTIQEQQIKNLHEQDAAMQEQLKKHAGRINTLQMKPEFK
jgi:septal ring factor EnvC (AmiA/AmiB activator)